MEQAAVPSYEGTIHDVLGVRIVEASPERVVLEMEVGPHAHQPMGVLHGGVSAVLAESAASIGGFLSVDGSGQSVLGTDLNISHLRAKRSGSLRATATPVRRGRTLHVWNIVIEDEDGKAIAVARCTLAVRPRPSGDRTEET